MSKYSDYSEMTVTSIDNKNGIHRATTHPMGNGTCASRIEIQFVSLAGIGLGVLLLIYTYVTDGHSNFSESELENSATVTKTCVPTKATNYNNTYPLTTPIRTSQGMMFRIGIVSDLDQESKSKTDDFTWLSYYKKGNLLWNPLQNSITVTWDSCEPMVLKSRLGEAGRGMELSELVVFNGKLYTMDDRTGIVYQLVEDRVIPFVKLNDGDGSINKGFKSEWATMKQRKLYVGGLGKEWTTNDGVMENTHPQWIKIISPTGEVEHQNWYQKYLALRQVLGIEFPGYVSHEAVVWSDVHNRWFFFPRRCSKESYNDVLDESRGCNVMITADESFTNIKAFHVANIVPTHGFSSLKFMPESSDQVIIALRSEEDNGTTATYIMGFDIKGKVLLSETKIADMKYEGLEFI